MFSGVIISWDLGVQTLQCRSKVLRLESLELEQEITENLDNERCICSTINTKDALSIISERAAIYTIPNSIFISYCNSKRVLVSTDCTMTEDHHHHPNESRPRQGLERKESRPIPSSRGGHDRREPLNSSIATRNKTVGNPYLQTERWSCGIISTNCLALLINKKLGEIPLDIISKNSPFPWF